jgi:hypothetical protein
MFSRRSVQEVNEREQGELLVCRGDVQRCLPTVQERTSMTVVNQLRPSASGGFVAARSSL